MDYVRVRNTLSGEVSSVPLTWLDHFPHLKPVDDDAESTPAPEAREVPVVDVTAVQDTPADLPAPPEEPPTTNHARSGHRSGWED